MLDPVKAVSKGFGPRSIRCCECKKLFRPHPRLKERQKTCAQRVCLLSYRARYRKQYRRANLEGEQDSQAKAKESRGADFWKTYRRSHPQSTERNRAQTRLRKQLRQIGLQRQLDIVQVIDPPGYFALFQGFAMSHRSLLESCRATRAA